MELTKIENHQPLMPLPNTYRSTFRAAGDNHAVSFPVHFDLGASLNGTNLLSRMIRLWGEIPIALISSLDLEHSTYGFIGFKDFMMYPFLRPGTFVQIDGRSTKVQKGVWQTQFDRPIYFVELRNGYACAWCELEGRELRLIPHPCSPCATRFLPFPATRPKSSEEQPELPCNYPPRFKRPRFTSQSVPGNSEITTGASASFKDQCAPCHQGFAVPSS